METFLYNLLIVPVEYILEFVYVFLKRIFNNPGYVIIGVSFVVNLLILPIYMRADAIQANENKKQKKIQLWQNRINKTFSGDERFMILQTYYREMNYKPFGVIKTLLPTLLQVPFFIAAFHFLSNLQDLNGAAFGPITDLSRPDALIHIGNSTINLLPLLMTLINMGSSVIYLHGFPIKSKLQTYILALLFLFLLYGSPSGLVFYWTLNNLFSLGKNIVMKLFPHKENGTDDNICKPSTGIKKIFSTQLLMFVLIGLVIPSALISSSASEFVVTAAPRNPVHYIYSTATVSAGFFLVWLSVFYFIASSKIKNMLQCFLQIVSMIFVINYMFFGKNLGIITADLFFSTYPHFSVNEKIINILVIISMIVALVIINKQAPSVIGRLYGILAFSLLIISWINIGKINKEIDANPYLLESKMRSDDPVFRLSKTGKNVVILSMDAMIGTYVPYMLAEKPELRDKYDGFTFYPNTVSFGNCTATGSPGILGGYEYAPYYSDLCNNKTLLQKNIEYTTILPILFSRNGWEVTACDTPYAGYQNTPDMSKINNIDGVKGIRTMGYYMDENVLNKAEAIRERNLFWYCLFKVTPVFAQTTVYDEGKYFSLSGISDLGGIYASHFIESYEVLHRLDRLTEITDENINTFLFLNNDIAHDTKNLCYPDYEPYTIIDSKNMDPGFRMDDNGNTFTLTTNAEQPSYYHVNMAGFMQIGNWLDYLKKEDVYDNTRIIIVSDHGRALNEFPDLGNPEIIDIEWVNCIFMVKDFYSHGFTTSDEFMSNADTPTIAMNNLFSNPVNPYTGNAINSQPKENGVIILHSNGFPLLPEDYTEYIYKEGREWIRVKDNIFDAANWEKIEQ